MLRNKKNVSIIAIVLIAIIGLVYAGCSKSTDMQTTPETNQVMSTMGAQNGNGDYNYQYIEIINGMPENPEDFKPLNPGLRDITDWMIGALENMDEEAIENCFKNISIKTALINKLNVVSLLLEKEKYTAAKNKIINDVINYIKLSVEDEIVKQEAISYLELVIWGLEHPNVSVN